MSQAIALIIPCYNEAARLDGGELLRLARARPDLGLILVDDGSTDATLEVLAQLQGADGVHIHIRRLGRNAGKAEAVRQGLLEALDRGAQVVGYADADLSTPVDELLRLIEDLERRPGEVLLGARVRLLGSSIERKSHRHYLGRIFATVASIALRVPVYDTQCGAKLFRATPALAAALREPFRTRWIFDVELLARLLRGQPGIAPVSVEAIRELPLARWRDVGGSKLGPRAMVVAGLQLLRLLVSDHLRRVVPAPRAPAPAAGRSSSEGSRTAADDLDGSPPEDPLAPPTSPAAADTRRRLLG
jgi:dolichyl-phosphate beta-glucosyltransferase